MSDSCDEDLPSEGMKAATCCVGVWLRLLKVGEDLIQLGIFVVFPLFLVFLIVFSRLVVCWRLVKTSSLRERSGALPRGAPFR